MKREDEVRRVQWADQQPRFQPKPPSTPKPQSINVRSGKTFAEIDTTDKTDTQLFLEGTILELRRDRFLLRGRVQEYLNRINIAQETTGVVYQARIDEELARVRRLMELYKSRTPKNEQKIAEIINNILPILMDRKGKFQITNTNINNFLETTVRLLLLRALNTALRGQVVQRPKSRHGNHRRHSSSSSST